MKKYLLLLSISLFIFACNKEAKISDLQYKVDKWDCYVYYNDKPYEGTIWSEDGKSYKAIVDCGILKRIEYYNEDGKLFCVVENREKKFYNEKGNEITRDQARELYRETYYNWKGQQSEFSEIAESHPYNN